MYYVYTLTDPRNDTIFYVGKGKGDRAWKHGRLQDGCGNVRKDRLIKKLHRLGMEPQVTIVKQFVNEEDAYDYEDQLTETIGIENLTNAKIGQRAPDQTGWTPSAETLAKRSASLKGIERHDEWRDNLSKSKMGANNPMYGKTYECSDSKRIGILRSKIGDRIEDLLDAIEQINAGAKLTDVDVSRAVYYSLKSGKHGIYSLLSPF